MPPAARRPTRAALLGFVLLILGSDPGVLAFASQSEPPAGTDRPTEAPPPDQAPPEAGEVPGSPAPEDAAPEVSPENQSPFLTRIYKIRPGKLWKGLLSTLEAEGFPPEETSQEGRTVKTSFVDFSQDKYPAQVAEPPLRLGRNYHILQMIKVKQGKVSLEGVVTPTKEGTELRLRARILVMGLDRARRVRILVDRRSTGVIEAGLIHRLEERLGIEHL